MLIFFDRSLYFGRCWQLRAKKASYINIRFAIMNDIHIPWVTETSLDWCESLPPPPPVSTERVLHIRSLTDWCLLLFLPRNKQEVNETKQSNRKYEQWTYVKVITCKDISCIFWSTKFSVVACRAYAIWTQRIGTESDQRLIFRCN